MDRVRGWSRPTVVIGAAALVGAALTVLILVITRDGPEPDTPHAGVTAAAVLADPERFVGTTVTVEDRVTDVVTAQSVTLGRGHLLVLNIAVAPGIDGVADADENLLGEAVAVTGTVRIFRMDEIEAEVGVLDEERFRVFSGLPVVIARSIVPMSA